MITLVLTFKATSVYITYQQHHSGHGYTLKGKINHLECYMLGWGGGVLSFERDVDSRKNAQENDLDDSGMYIPWL